MSRIEAGQIWQDLDYRSYWDSDPDGNPIDRDYVGPVKQRPRLVRVERVEDRYVYVRTLHTGRPHRILASAFFSDARTKRGTRRSQGFVPTVREWRNR